MADLQPFPLVPPEIVQAIIRQSTRPPSYHSTRPYHILRRYSLVNQTWRVYAQEELFTSVVVRNRWKMALFLDALQKKASLGRLVKQLSLGYGDGVNGRVSGESAMEILRLCRNVEDVRLWDVAAFPLLDMPELPELRSLVIDSIELARGQMANHSRIPLCLPSLAQLSLFNVSDAADALSTFVLPSILPRLRALACTVVHPTSSSVVDLGRAITSVSGQLDVLSVSIGDEFVAHLTGVTCRIIFDIPLMHPRRSLIDLPPTFVVKYIRQLQDGESDSSPEEQVALLLAAFPDLEYLSLPRSWTADEVPEALEACALRNIRVGNEEAGGDIGSSLVPQLFWEYSRSGAVRVRS